MTIFIDIDDTISNFAEVLLKYLNNKNNTSYNIKEITSWNWICEKFNNPWEVISEVFWEEVNIIEEAKNFIKKRLEKNDEIYLVSATFIDNNLPIKIEKTIEKLDNLIDKNHIIITNNKTLLCGDIMIDDGIHNLINNHCKINICFAQPWNWSITTNSSREYFNIIRTNEWDRINDIVEYSYLYY